MTAALLQALPDKTPQNLDAEQALLGKLLLEPHAFRYVNPRLVSEHFYEPVHQRIYSAILKLREEGKTVTPLVMKHYFDQDKGLSDIGGGEYLCRLAAAAITIMNVTDVSEAIIDLALRRELLAACHETMQRLMHDEEFGVAAEAVAELMRAADAVAGVQEDVKFQDDYEICQSILDRMNRREEPYSTGIVKLDEAMGGGLFPGFSYGFAARKKVGKTVLAGTISHNLNKRGIRHIFICGEMSPEEVHQRNLCRELGFFPSIFRSPKAQEFKLQERIAALAAASKRACIYRKAPGLTFSQLRQIVASAVERKNITGMILDYWQLVGGKPSGKSTAEHLDEVAQWIADYCRREGLWSIVMAQINQDGNTRGGEGLRLAFDQVYQIHRDDPGKPEAWVEMMETRYTPWVSIGSEAEAGLLLNEQGPYFEETGYYGEQ